MLVLTGGTAASAAPGDYSLTMTAPSSVVVGAAYNYTVQITADASPGAPADGIVLTTVLPEGVVFDSVPTGSGSPVASFTYDGATRTVVFTLKPIVEPLSTFVFSVQQNNNSTKSNTTVLTTSITGTADSAGPVASQPVDTALTGNYDYIPIKEASVVVGSGNRTVTYFFNVQTEHVLSGDTFSIDAATITDVIADGAVIVAQSSGFGSWSITGQTAVWSIEKNYGPSSDRLDSSSSAVWLTVTYPEEQFPTGTLPPVNVADLTVVGTNDQGHVRPPARAQGPELGPSGNGTVVGIAKTADSQATPGYINNGFRVSASWLSSEGITAESLTVQDSSSLGSNALYFNHIDVTALNLSFNPILRAANVPFQVQYQTNLNQAFTTLDASLTTGSNQKIVVQREGSFGWGSPPYLDLPVGARLTGWRIVLSPTASDAVVPSGSQVTVDTGYQSSYESLVDGSTSEAAIPNTATVDVVPSSGPTQPQGSSTAATQFIPGVYVTTNIVGPSSINVGDKSSYRAGIVNQHPTDTYAGSQMRVVLPYGVRYDESIGVSRVIPVLEPGVVPVPDIGSGVSVATEFTTDPVTGESLQVLVFTFDSLPPMRAPNTVNNRYEENRGFQYDIPVVALAQAYDPADETAQARSYAQANDPAYADVPYRGYGPFWSADTFDFDPQRTNIGYAATTARVNTAGGLLLSKLSSADGNTFNLASDVQSPGTGAWQVFVSNVLPGPVTSAVVFDRLPFVGDAAESAFATVLSGPVTGAPAAAVVEYSSDATSATTGTWSSNASGATAFRVSIPAIESGVSFTLLAPVSIPANQTAGSVATNLASATGIYTGTPRAFVSNESTMVVAADPSISLVKKTNGIDVSEAPGPTLVAGSEVTWQYLVTNDGTVPLTAVSVTDDIEGLIQPPADFDGTLDPGQTVTFTATGTVVAGQYSNVGTASGTPGAATPLTATDPSWYTGVEPSLSLVKKTNGTVYDSAPGAGLTVGDAVSWTYEITNTSEARIDGIVLSDDIEGVIAAPAGFDGSLEPGESVVFTATGTATAGLYRNEAIAKGDSDGVAVDSNSAVSYYTAVTVPVTPSTPAAVKPSGLASTGSGALWIALLGGAVLAAGGTLLFWRRRRPQAPRV